MVRDQTFKRMHFIHELRNSQQTVNIGADEGTEVLSFKINKKIKRVLEKRYIC